MQSSVEMPWDWLENRSATLFVAAVGMLVAAGAHRVLEATAGVALNDYLLNLTGQGGLVLSLVALLGLYPVLSDRTPRLAKVGAGSGFLGVVSFTVALLVLGAVLAVNAVAGTSLPAEVAGVLFLPGYLGAVLGFLAFGIASVRADAPSRAVGVLLLLVVLVPLTMTVWFAVFGSRLISIDVAGLGLLDIWLPAVLLCVGGLLHNGVRLSDRRDSSGEPMT